MKANHTLPPRLLALLACQILAVAALLHAQLPTARLLTLFPPGGKLGSVVEITLDGVDLDEATHLNFSHAGLTSAAKLAANGQPEAGKFLVNIGAAVPPGVYEARVVGRYGISNARAFAVGDQAELQEKAGNNVATNATEIAIGSIVNGTANANSVDYFRFTAKKGQRLILICAAKVIDSRMDPVLAVLDANGREMERNRQGAIVDFTAPADGAYTIKAHDFLYRGGGEYFYRLGVSAAPHIDLVMPPAGQPGTRAKYTVYGRNLPGGTPSPLRTGEGKPLDQLVVEIDLPATSQPLGGSPSAATLDGIEYRLKSPQGVSNPSLIGFASGVVTLETQPNDRPEQAQKVSVPGELAGQFFPRGDVDWFSFEAKKGDVYWIEVVSQRLGLPTAPFALFQRVTRDAKGQERAGDLQELAPSDTNLGGTEFNTSTRDITYRFEAQEDAMYRLGLRDLFSHALAPANLVYRVIIRKQSHDFHLVALAQAGIPAKKDTKSAMPSTLLVRKGGVLPVRVVAFRRDGFTGPIDLTVQGLPAGVTAGITQIAEGQNNAMLLIKAGETAINWSGAVTILGKATVNGAPVAREARAGSVTWGIDDVQKADSGLQSRFTRNLALAVNATERSPVILETADNKPLETHAAGKINIPIKIVRDVEFTEALKLKVVGHAAFDKMKEVDVAAKGTNATIELDIAAAKLAAGTYSFMLQTQAKGKYRRVPLAEVQAIEAKAKDAEKSAVEAAAAVKAASDQVSKAADPGAKAAAEKVATEAKAKAQTADAKKTEMTARAKEMAQKSQPKDVIDTFYSDLVTVRVLAAPFTLAPVTAAPLDQGAKIEIPINLTRLFDYVDPIEVNLAPQTIKGVTAAKITVAKDQAQAKFVIEAAATAAAGEHPLRLQATVKINGQTLIVEQPFTLKIAAKAK
ncbi:MAG: hypothetical protein EXS19_02115 [Pedosphaera sp.]|nr:hypothetical protein [Pedosphaera sp.]